MKYHAPRARSPRTRNTQCSTRACTRARSTARHRRCRRSCRLTRCSCSRSPRRRRMRHTPCCLARSRTSRCSVTKNLATCQRLYLDACPLGPQLLTWNCQLARTQTVTYSKYKHFTLMGLADCIIWWTSLGKWYWLFFLCDRIVSMKNPVFLGRE